MRPELRFLFGAHYLFICCDCQALGVVELIMRIEHIFSFWILIVKGISIGKTIIELNKNLSKLVTFNRCIQCCARC